MTRALEVSLPAPAGLSKAAAVWTGTPAREKDGFWRVSGYDIK